MMSNKDLDNEEDTQENESEKSPNRSPRSPRDSPSPRRSPDESPRRSPSPGKDLLRCRSTENTSSMYTTVTDDSAPLSERLSRSLELLQDAHEDLKAGPLKEYGGLEALKEALSCVKVVGEEFERDYLGMCRDMGAIREVLEDIQGTVTSKLTNEGLHSWLDGPPAHPAGEGIID